MYRQVLIPTAEIPNMKATHMKVMAGLLAFSNAAGKCWPSQRTIAKTVGMSLTAVQRALSEMTSLAYLSARPRIGTSSIYQIAKRFLPDPEFRKRNTQPPAPPRDSAIHPQDRSSDIGTEGKAKKKSQLESKGGHQGSGGRDAPLAQQPPAQIPNPSQAVTPEPEFAPGPKMAYAQARDQKPVSRSGPNSFKRRAWLTKINAFVGERLRGTAQWQGWELVSKAQLGTLEGAEQRALDALDRAMRSAPGPEPENSKRLA